MSHPRTHRILLSSAVAFCVALISFAISASPTYAADCGQADNAASLAQAIHCVNNAGAGTHHFEITKYIALHQATPAITNQSADLIEIDGKGRTINGRYRGRVIHIGTGANVLIKSLEIENGTAHAGGGIYNAGSLTLENVTVRKSKADLFGGGIYNAGFLSATNSALIENSAETGGGLMSFYGAELIVKESKFERNTATAGGGGLSTYGPASLFRSVVNGNRALFGGGLLNEGHLTMTDMTFDANVATQDAGGFCSSAGGLVEASKITVTKNQAAGFGGGILNEGQMTIDGAEISQNSANSGGGGFINYRTGTLMLTHATVAENNTSYDGAGFRNAGTLEIGFSTLHNNRTAATSGAGVNYGYVLFYNSTISRNSANFDAGGVSMKSGSSAQMLNTTIAQNDFYGLSSYNSDVNFLNTLIAENGSDNCHLVYSVVNSRGYNLDTDNTCDLTSNSDISNGNANLGPLQDNGGQTLTHALLAGSDAIDAGQDSRCNQNPIRNLDQRDEVRPQGDHCDIGAYEASDEPPVVDDEDRLIYISPSTGGRVGGVRFADEDVIAYNSVTEAWSMVFDGSDMGLNRNDVDGLALMDDGSLLLSFIGSQTLPGAGAVRDSDIVQFIPTALGTNTAGTFELFFDGSDARLSSGSEDIDAIAFTPDGKLVISTVGSFSVPGIAGRDEDLIIFNVVNYGPNTSGSWARYFDGSDVALRASAEDISSAWIDGDGVISLSTLGAFNVPNATGNADDIFNCTPSQLGATTECAFASEWDGESHGFKSWMKISALHIDESGVLAADISAATSAEESAAEAESNAIDDVDEYEEVEPDEGTDAEHGDDDTSNGGDVELYLPLVSR